MEYCRERLDCLTYPHADVLKAEMLAAYRPPASIDKHGDLTCESRGAAPTLHQEAEAWPALLR